MNEDKIILTKEEYDDLCTNYDKVYEQAKADILGNMSDGGTSCHWCIDENRRIGKEEALRQIWHKVADGDLPTRVGQYLCITKTGCYACFNYSLVDNAFLEQDALDKEFYITNRVVAWAALPEYEE